MSEWRRRFDPEEATSPSLETHALKAGLAWLIDGKASGDLEVDRTLALDLWRVEARRQREKADAQDREYALPSQTLGYDLLRFMARLALASDREGAAALWRAIFEHGPAAHHAIRIFLDGLFHALLGDVDPDLFMVVWTDVIDYALSGVWPTQDRLWFHEERTLGGVLGFGEETALARLEPTAIARLTGRYAVWAQGNLRASRESLPRYARFLASSAGRPLRMAGLKQLAAALAPAVIGETSVLEDGGVDALGSLIHAVLRDDLPALRADRTAYEAVVTLVGRIALTASPMALVLQERVAGLR